MNIRIQIYRTLPPPPSTQLPANPPQAESEETVRPVDVLMKGLDDLSDLCDVVRDKFVESCDAFGKHAPA